MNTGAAFWFIMTVGGAVLLGVALAYGLISTRKRRENPLAQRLTDAATREIYNEEEDARRSKEGPEPPDEHRLNVTKSRQGVTGHNVNIVLAASLALAVFAGIGLYAFLSVLRG
jgi:Flp pilus assembly protein TadB